MIFFVWFTNIGLDGIENMEFIDCCPSGLFSSRVSVLQLVIFAFNRMCQSLNTGHSQPFITSASDIFILAVCPSYMFNLSPM